MKRIMLVVAITTILGFSSFSYAQSSFDKVYEKYAGVEGYTAVNISKDMFQMFQSLGNDSDPDAKEIKKVISQLSGLKVLSCNSDSLKPQKAQVFYNEVVALYPASVYKELMTINDGGENVRFLTKQDGAGRINELVMLLKGKHEATVLTLTGNIDLSTISKLSKSMNIHGMEDLGKLKPKVKK